LLVLFFLVSSSSWAQPPADTDWTHYAADAAATKYAPLDQINPTNFNRLEIVWRYLAPDADIASSHGLGHSNNRGTPLVVGGVLYYGSPFNILCAVDARSGKEKWTFDPQVWRQRSGFLGNSRGIAYWEKDGTRRLFYGTGNARLYAVDADNGKPDPRFGQEGSIDLTQGLRRSVDSRRYGVTSPPAVCRDVVIVGSAIHDWRFRTPPEYTSPGDVRGFDARTGKLLWTFHTIPQDGEHGNKTWENDAWKRYGAANVWAAMAVDEGLGYVYLPVSTPSHDFYGGERPGDNLFGESLVCLDARTGERVWHFQLVHHGLWDYDPPAAPVLLDIRVAGRPIKAVAQVTKQGFCYVFDRTNGKPVWPIEEQPVPQSKVKGEKSAPTQPFPTRPAAFDRQGLAEDDLIDFTPQLRREALTLIADFDYGPLYTPPSLNGTITLPGLVGGADWAGAASHPGKGLLFVPSHTIPSLLWLQAPRWGRAAYSEYAGYTRDHIDGPRGLPLTKPPYGRITAIDLNSGEHLWMQPVGRGPADHPLLRPLDLPDLGWPNRHFIIATDALLLVGAQDPRDLGSSHNAYPIDPEADLRAYDLDTGDLVGRIDLPGNAYGNPMTYMAGGRQFIVVPIGNHNNPPELVGLALPQD
jgi:quinoprotein glucose dehydrogenase